MSRRPNDQAFTKSATKRLMRIADEQGVKKYRIVVGSENGRPTYTLIVDNTLSATEQQGDLDSWMDRHAS